ncbi:MAG: hypothetical protein ACFFER_15540, partial [Candidatus Thorarchaeota archaeon]
KEHYSQALDYESSGEFEKALESYLKVLSLEPEHEGAQNAKERVLRAIEKRKTMKTRDRVILVYHTATGERIDDHVGIESTEVRIRRGIIKIDLSPLSSLPDLQHLILKSNKLQVVDLTPLSKCNQLLNLDLSGNMLDEVDLSPLSQCTNLQELSLSANKLKTIDLSPLSHHTTLKKIGLMCNQLEEIDLSPLSSLKKTGGAEFA